MKYLVIAHDINGGFTLKCNSLEEATSDAIKLSKLPDTTIISITVIEKTS